MARNAPPDPVEVAIALFCLLSSQPGARIVAMSGHLIKPTTTWSAHTHFSSYRESLLEHLFLGELLRHLWWRGRHDVEVMRPQVDAAGCDVVVESTGAIRHIQLKASFLNMKHRRVSVNAGLARKPSGCVVWLCFDKDTMRLDRFYWFGALPGQALPKIDDFPLSKHAKAKSNGERKARINSRSIPKTAFKHVKSIKALAVLLFGSIP
jgi:hypothetical protein